MKHSKNSNSYPLRVRTEYDAPHPHERLGLIRIHFQNTCPMFQRTLESNPKCPIHFPMNRHKTQNIMLHNVDR